MPMEKTFNAAEAGNRSLLAAKYAELGSRARVNAARAENLPTIDFRGCRDIPPVGASFCQAGVIAERIDSFGCLAEYVCMIDGRPANPCEALGGACLPIVHGVCRIWGQPESCDAAVGVGCCLVPASVTAQSYPVTASR